MTIIYVKGFETGDCNHPDGPGTDTFAPELCCPDNLITCHYDDTVEVDCNHTCAHHKNHGGD